MEQPGHAAERRFGLNRYAMAGQTVFMSHETYTPARGGSAAAEVIALRNTFGEAANDIVVANTKGFTGHPMGVGVEDVIAVKILEYGIVPPVPNFKEVDPTWAAQPEPRRPLSGAVRAASGGRLRLADFPDPDAAHPRRPGPGGQQAALPALAGRRQRLRPGRAGGDQAQPARQGYPAAGGPEPARLPDAGERDWVCA
jgi:hypothetical protein